MPTKRTPIHRSPFPHITPTAVSLYERAKRLIARGNEDAPALRDISYELAVELKLKPWMVCPLDTLGFTAPSPWEGDSWWQAAALADELEEALKARREAARKAKRAQKAAEPPPPSPPPAS